MEIGRTYVSDLLNLVSAWDAPMVSAESKNVEICYFRLPENAFTSTRTAKNIPYKFDNNDRRFW